jgi:cobalt-zinc-cadmium resistance protein CzcA
VIGAHAPGAALSFTQPIQMRFNELLGGSVSDVAIGIEGEDLGELQRLAEAVAAQVRGVAGATDVRISAPPAVSLVEVRPRALDAAAMGLSTREVLDVVRALRVGLDAGRTYDGPIAVPVRVRLGDGASAYTVGDVAVPIVALAHPEGSGGAALGGAPEHAGGLVPLSRIADLVDTQTPSLVEHRNGQRRIVVGFNVRGADLGTVVADARTRVAAQVERPRGYALRWGGQIESLEEARGRLAVVIPIVLVTILALLVWLFRAWRPAAIIFLNVPFAAVGGTVALTLRGMPVSISAAIGFIALSGIAVLNGVVLISRVRTLELEGHDAGSAVREAARGRMRPVLMTALVAALGFVPMMLATGVGAEVQRPLASVVVGGLVTSTLLTLVVLPALYPWLAARRRPPALIAAPPTIDGGAP